jgi:hypothetical protein
VELLEGGVVVGSAIAGAGGVALVQVASDLAAGAHAFAARITVDGSSTNPSHAVTVTIDTTGPAGAFTVNGDSTVLAGMVATDDPFLTIDLAFADASGLARMQFSADGGLTWTEAEDYFGVGALELVGEDGVYTVLVRVTDAAGNAITVSKQVRLDRSGPKTTIGGVANGNVYDLGQTITVTFSATDASTVASVSATLDSTKTLTNGAVIKTNTLTAGVHTIQVTATDALGNQTTTSVTFTIRVSTNGLQGAVADGQGRKLVDNSVASTLITKLKSAQAAIDRGNAGTARQHLESFMASVAANAGKKIDAAYAALLLNWANDLLSRL